MTSLFKKYFLGLLTLSFPIMLGHLGNILIGVVDVIIAGRHSTLTLGAISVATAISMTLIIAGIGFMSSISVVIANRRGQKVPSKHLFKTTLLYALFVGAIIFILNWIAIFLVPKINLAQGLTPLVVEYLIYTSPSIFGVIIFVAIKEFLQAYEKVLFPNIISIISIFINLFLNIIFVFGYGKIPALGALGLAIATLITRILQAVIMLIYTSPLLKIKARQAKNYIKDLIKVGWPISLALFTEFLGFNTTAVLVGKFSALYSAVHNIIITLSSVTYILPLSISNAVAIKVGFANGEKNIGDIIKYASCGIIIVIGFMFIVAPIYLNFPTQIISIFTEDKNVISTAIPVLLIVVCFLLFDGIQAISTGGLRGLKKTQPIMWTMMCAYLVFGIPIGCIFAYKYNIVLSGFWIGLAIALFVASVTSTSFLIHYIKKASLKYHP